MPKTQTITLKRVIAAPAAEVYRMFTRASNVRTWFCDAAQVDARKGGRLYFWWNDDYQVMGQFTAAEPGKKLAFTWRGHAEPDASRAQVTLKEKDGHTTVKVAHTLGAGKAWAQTAEGLEGGWKNSLENLQSVLETGEDLRITRRPMLGITSMEELTPDMAARLGVPVANGIRIGDTVEGMGARAAGLQADDVVVSIGKTKLTRFQHIAPALQPHHAGDTVPVTFYRGAQKHTLPMTLSRRPLPAMPATGAELAEQVRALYSADEAALAKVFEGVTEAEASRRAEPKEWSAKEVLTHLITGERGTADFLSEMLTDSERWYDDFDNELDARPASLIAVHPTINALLDELKRAQAEVTASLAALPSEVVARKRTYWRICFNFMAQGPTHVTTHLAQIQKALAAARGA